MASLRYPFFIKHPIGIFIKIIGCFLKEQGYSRSETVKKLIDLVPNALEIYNKEMRTKYSENDWLERVAQRAYICKYDNDNDKGKVKRSSEHPLNSNNLKDFILHAQYLSNILSSAKYIIDDNGWRMLMSLNINEFEKRRIVQGFPRTFELFRKNFGNESLFDMKLFNKFHRD